MKKLLFILLFVLSLLHSSAQREYWGMTVSGGKDFDSVRGGGAGVIFKTRSHGQHYQVAYNFDSATGIQPWGSLIQATNGKLYGLTGRSTSAYPTYLFEFNPITGVYKTLLLTDTLSGGGGFYEYGAPFQASNGKIYSLAWNKLIETDPVSGTNEVVGVATFGGGENYFMQASNGNIYFVIHASGATTGIHGALFEFNLVTRTLTRRYHFIDQYGSSPEGSPVEWTPGVLYGVYSFGTDSDSTKNRGGIYSYNLNTSTYSFKQGFFSTGIRTTGGIAFGGLTRFGNKLYGATQVGGVGDFGFLYSYDPATNVIDTLINFETANYYNYKYDSVRGVDIFNRYGWELTLGHDNRLYGLSRTCIFAYDPITTQYESLNALTPGFTVASSQLGVGTVNAHPLEVCLKPYHFTTIPDTLHFLVNQPGNFTIHTPNTDTFHWTKNNLPFSQTDSTLSFSSVAWSDSGRYQCLLVNECGDSLVKSFYVKVEQMLPTGLTLAGKVQSNNAVLQWRDEAANNVAKYELQRSVSSNNFTAIAQTLAQRNQSDYVYTDENFANAALNGKVFYRLKQIGRDGREEYSNIVLLTTQSPQPMITPNPAKDRITITFNKRVSGKVSFELYAANGQLVQTAQGSNLTTEVLDISLLTAGVYSLKIVTSETAYTSKIVKQ